MNEYTMPLSLLIGGIIFAIILLILNYNQQDTSWKKTVKSKLFQFNKDLQTNNIDTLKILLINTDKLLYYTMEKRGIKGNTTGEKLKNAKKNFVGNNKKKDLYNKIWKAHKLRNKMAHTINMKTTKTELRNSYSNLKQGIKSLL